MMMHNVSSDSETGPSVLNNVFLDLFNAYYISLVLQI
uniref:Uncharacterized protein n=1 Tax=Anguilla anguilla TaxID=7936 RepID=A0A0E9XD22_ANGAN